MKMIRNKNKDSMKRWVHDFSKIIPTLKRTDFPSVVLLETTAYCNLNCSMCPHKTLERQKGEMTLKTFSKIIDEIALENPTTDLWLAIMGEATLLKNKLIDMVNYAKGKGIHNIFLNTNALPLYPQLSNKLLDSGLKEIIVGVDAYTKETYDKIRVGGNFNLAKENIEYLLQTRKDKNIEFPHVIMQYIVMDENEDELEEFKDYWLKRGAFIKVRPKIGWGTAVKTRDLNLSETARTFPCPMLIRNCAIHWDGTIAHCSDADFEGRYKAGHIDDLTIKEVWNGELAKRREKHWNGDFTHDLCSTCKDWQTGRSLFFSPEIK